MSNNWHQKNMRVQYKDTDQMGVVHHSNYITWFEVGRTESMRDQGISYRKMEEMDLLLPVLDVQLSYKRPAHFDDCVAIYTKLASYSPVRLEFHYEVRRISEEGFVPDNAVVVEPVGELLTKGTTKHMWINPEWKPVRLNRAAPEIYQKLEELLGEEE
ncbi:acyl-CoA thioesterase [Oceanobacillus sp. CAU 1775]